MPPTSKSSFEQTALAFAERRPLLRARDLAALGVPTVVLSRLVSASKLERIARGVYSLPGRTLSEHRSLAEVALRVPRGVVCLLSALRVHGIGTQAPFEVWVALPPHSPTPRLDQPALRVVRMSGAALTEGLEPFEIDGVTVPFPAVWAQSDGPLLGMNPVPSMYLPMSQTFNITPGFRRTVPTGPSQRLDWTVIIPSSVPADSMPRIRGN